MQPSTTNTDHLTSSSTLIESNRVEGTEVYDTSGKHIGAVKRLVIEKVSGRVVYAIVAFGGFLGMGTDEFTIPWSALKYDTHLGGFATNITSDQLRDSPDVGRNNRADLWANRDNESSLYDYYGSPYYWTE
jgi:sporulation protein YlmC with PRC-barrel domain